MPTDAGVTGLTSRSRSPRWLVRAFISLAASICAWGIGYLYFATAGPFLSSVPPQRFVGTQLTVSRGLGGLDGSRLVVRATDDTGLAIVSLDTLELRAVDYRRVLWTLRDAPDDVVLATLWRTDQAAGKVNSAPLLSGNHTFQVLFTPGKDNWIGNIDGIALAVKGTLREPLIIEAVRIDAMSATDVLADRVRDWFAFTPWNGLSINTAFGGLPDQPLWLPLVTAIVALTAVAMCLAWRRRQVGPANPQFSLAILVIVAVGWITLDARWLWIRMQQTQLTVGVFSGKSPRDKHIADLDGYAFAFAEQVRLRLPKTTPRVYVTADDHYFGARMAYHLYPNNAYVDHGSGSLPPPAQFKPGEYIVVFRRHGVQYDMAQQMLSWDGQPPLRAQLLLAHLGNAMFKLL